MGVAKWGFITLTTVLGWSLILDCVPGCFKIPWQTKRDYENFITPDKQSFNPSQWPTWCTNFNTSITILYMYMFRAISCSSSGGQIVL